MFYVVRRKYVKVHVPYVNLYSKTSHVRTNTSTSLLLNIVCEMSLVPKKKMDERTNINIELLKLCVLLYIRRADQQIEAAAAGANDVMVMSSRAIARTYNKVLPLSCPDNRKQSDFHINLSYTNQKWYRTNYILQTIKKGYRVMHKCDGGTITTSYYRSKAAIFGWL